MTAKWLQAETSEDGRELRLVCWFDTSKALADGSPDPAFVVRCAYGLDKTFTAERAIEECKRLIEANFAPRPANAVPMKENGEEFSLGEEATVERRDARGEGEETRGEKKQARGEPSSGSGTTRGGNEAERSPAADNVSQEAPKIQLVKILLQPNKDALVIGVRDGNAVAGLIPRKQWEALPKEKRRDRCLALLALAEPYEEPVMEEIEL